MLKSNKFGIPLQKSLCPVVVRPYFCSSEGQLGREDRRLLLLGVLEVGDLPLELVASAPRGLDYSLLSYYTIIYYITL